MKISYDPGHYSVSAYNGEGEPKSELSVIGEPRGDLMQANNRREIISEFGHWFVGQTALKQSGNLIFGRDEMWAYTDAYRSLMLYILSQFYAPETDSGVVELCMGLPIQDYKNNRDELKGMLERNYKIERSRCGKKDKRDLRLLIRNVLFLPQGLAPARPYLVSGKKLVCLDLGSRNINFITIDITDGQLDIIEKDTRSREAGATDTINSIIGDIADISGREFSIPQIVKLIESGEDSVTAGNQPFDVGDILGEHLGAYRNKILTLITDVWGNARDIDNFIVFGGGDYLAGETIQQKYPHQTIRLPDPLYSTVKAQYGYLVKKGG
jgi:hypothetical protein